MAISYLGLGGALLSFGGGVFLACDSLRAQRTTLLQFGSRKLAESEAKRTGKPPLYETPDHRPLASELDWELWLADHTRKRTWIGFAIISAGFLLDFVSRILGG